MMLRNLSFAVASAIIGLTCSPVAALAQPSPSQASPPNSALTGRFTTFFTTVLAGHVPSGITPAMRTGMTSQVLAQIDAAFTNYGKFRSLDFANQDTMSGYQRYHYNATFDKGSIGVMFVVDSSGTIAGFFQDPSLPATSPGP